MNSVYPKCEELCHAACEGVGKVRALEVRLHFRTPFQNYLACLRAFKILDNNKKLRIRLVTEPWKRLEMAELFSDGLTYHKSWCLLLPLGSCRTLETFS